ncbi:MAG: 50S ribosomal protein L10 [Clostridiales bacterium]|nr:MAG: 50S ribosomal protein L10 [Clostridiales bacterium]
MPSEKILESKKELVNGLAEKLKNAVAGVLVDYKGIDVATDTKMRKELREAGVDYFVVKNTMLRFATKEVGYDFDEVLNGTTALAVSTEDQMAAARILVKYSEELKGAALNVKAGFMDGAAIDVDTVKAIAKIPSRETLVAQMLSSLNAPIANLAVVLDQIAQKSA